MIDSKKYTYLMCSERSGSNFITKILNNHSQICGPATKHILNPFARNYFRYEPLKHTDRWDELIKDLLNLFQVEFSLWKADFAFEELLKNVSIGDVSALIDYFFSKEMDIHDKRQLFIKEIKLYEFYPFIKRYFTEASFVYLVRDPRDMGLSWRKSIIHPGGIVNAARQWKNDQQQYLKIKSLEEESNNITFLKYENLVSNPKNELLKVFEMLNIDFEESMLEMGKDDLTNKNAGQQKAWENLSKPIMQNNYNKYRKDLNKNEIEIIERICYFEMIHLGYIPDNNWEEIKSISNKQIELFHQTELEELEYSPVEGVLANMEAKKKFYEKL